MIDLPKQTNIRYERRRKLEDVLRSIETNPPGDIASVIRDKLSINLATTYGGQPIAHPIGKASGQLSCTISQVEEDAESGLAFVVLKTVIAESESGVRSMGEWANPETKMRLERRVGSNQREGWTVTWKGRGWPGSLSDYCNFFDGALTCAADTGLLVVPSVKYHLPALGEPHRALEYEHTTKALEHVWMEHMNTPLILEKDLSPTLAGDARAKDQNAILYWLTHLSTWIRDAATVRLGIKVMNAVYDDDFQLEMLRALSTDFAKPDFLVVFNRLFDQTAGVAYGGWDLSDRNLRTLEQAHISQIPLPPLSGTGNICSGRMMIEYALRGCTNGQVHTFFQVPRTEYLTGTGSRTRRALYTLLLDPDDGVVPWLWTLNELGHIDAREGQLHFQDVVGLGFR